MRHATKCLLAEDVIDLQALIQFPFLLYLKKKPQKAENQTGKKKHIRLRKSKTASQKIYTLTK